MTNPEQPPFLWEFALETNLLKACVRSVVYRLITDLDDLCYARNRWLVKEYIRDKDPCELGQDIFRAENQLWYSVIRMKYLIPAWYDVDSRADTGFCYIKVKQMFYPESPRMF